VTAIPQHVHDRARKLAEVHPMKVVAEIIGVRPGQLSRMKKRGWIARADGSALRPMPADFPIQSRHMSHRELSVHYRTGMAVVRRWFSELPNPRPSRRGLKVRQG